MQKFILNKNDAGQRLDKFLTKSLKGIPMSLMYKYIRKKRVKVNGKRAKENQMLAEGDVIELYIPDEFSKAEADTGEYDKVKASPVVIYEDENLIICDKRAGMLSHTGDKGENGAAAIPERDTLIFIIRAYLYKKGEYDPEDESSFAPALANRLDRNTGGLVIAAKNAEALREINRLIRDGCVDKRYLCAVHGRPSPASGTLRGFLFKNSKTKTVTVYSAQRQGAKEIITSYKTEKYSKEKDLSLLEVHLETGRTHQIRAHLASIGHPLLGEGKYGQNRGDRAMGYKYQALYSYRLSFSVCDGPLAYLDGKTFEADRKNIPFLSLF
ncbi:MAG: RluA family pseudouridine synthase [Ruminococcaceae bacterium]|nr:RluA family pseudouridine synthase [Oscillospiraceae bacterium]